MPKIKHGCFGALLVVCWTIVPFIGWGQPNPVQKKVIGVFVSKAQQKTVPLVIRAYGHVKAVQSVDLSFGLDGTLDKVNMHSGQRVKKGEVIATLDDRTDEAQLTSLKSDLEVAQSNYERMQQIQQFGAVSKKALESQKAEVVKAKALVKQQEVTISQKKLTAPFDGVLGLFKYNAGAYLPKGTALVSLVQQAPVLVVYTVPANYRSQVEIGQSVTVTSSSYPDKKFTGILSFLSPQVNKGSGTITLEAKVENPDYFLMPGMFVTIKQAIDPDRKLLVVPDVALMADINGQYVYKVEEGLAKKTYVKTDQLIDGFAVIQSGLKAGDVVVTAGQQKLDSGDRVKVLQTALTKKEALKPAPANKAGQEKSSVSASSKTTSTS